ncbi:MAG TPA: M23 family metallopeptidase, partial [bacterium]|nr:M23 family metallopeptidase [bacterium]
MQQRHKACRWSVLAAPLVAVFVFVPVLLAATDTTSYIVQAGDTLSAIARRHGSSAAALAGANSLANPNLIFPGQRLQIPGRGDAAYTIRSGDTLWDISRGKGISLTALRTANPGIDPHRLRVGSTIILPPSERPLPSRQGTISNFVWPVRGKISSTFGWRNGRMHEGLDIATAAGSIIRAAALGRVVDAGWCGGYGQRIVVDHGRGVATLYAHCSALLAKPGEQVVTGQAIARVGSSGNSTG